MMMFISLFSLLHNSLKDRIALPLYLLFICPKQPTGFGVLHVLCGPSVYKGTGHSAHSLLDVTKSYTLVLQATTKENRYTCNKQSLIIM